AVFDSDAAVGEEGVGNQTIYGSFTSSDGAAHASASWIGFIKPEASTQGGEAAAYPNVPVDLDLVADEVFDLADRKVTVMADFKGSSSGTPTLSALFYRADQLIGSESAPGRAFGTDGFTKSWAVFDIPEGTTRIRPRVAALEREVDDTVDFDRVGVMLGALADETAEPQWRNGTARPEHPVWSHPVIEYQ